MGFTNTRTFIDSLDIHIIVVVQLWYSRRIMIVGVIRLIL